MRLRENLEHHSWVPDLPDKTGPGGMVHWTSLVWCLKNWAAAGFKDTELGVWMEPEVDHGATEVLL